MSGYEKFMSSILRAGSASIEPELEEVLMEEPDEVFAEESEEEFEEEPEEYVEEPKQQEPKSHVQADSVWPPLINQYNFYGATQRHGESYTDFAIRLRDLSLTCNLHNLEDSLWHRFYLGMLPGPERAMLCSVKLCEPMTLAKAVAFVEGMRYTRGVTKHWVPPPMSLLTSMDEEDERSQSTPRSPSKTYKPGLRYKATTFRMPYHKGYGRSENGFRIEFFGNTKAWYGRDNINK